MRLVAATVWTSQRRFLGNFIPALFWLPLALAGLYQLFAKGLTIGLGLWLLVASTILGWIALNFFGLFQNGRMRRQLERILQSEKRDLSGEHFFVGFATPKYSSMVDAHEDVGFLRLLKDKLEFVSEVRTIEMSRAEITDIRFRMNVHSIVGLGRWVSVEAKLGDKPIRLLIEPRERATLLGNRIYSSTLRARLREWRKTGK